LPLLEYLLEQLWEKRDKEKNQLTFEAYDALGKLEGAIGKKAGQVYEKLGSQEQKAMPELIIMLASVSESSKNITAKRVSKHQIDKDPAIKACATALMAKDVRLLVSAKDKEGLEYYRVAHESLFSHWALAKETILVHKKDIYLRDQLEKRSQAWKESQAKDKKSLLLNDGLPLNEALELLSRRERSLAVGVVAFVRASEEHVKKGKRRNRFIIGTILVVSILVSFFMYGLKMEFDNLNEKLGIIVDKLFSIGANSSGEKKVDVLTIYQTIIDEFKDSRDQEIIKLVEYSYYNMGNAYGDKKEYDKAIKAYQKAIEINPKKDEAYYNMGIAYGAKKEYDQAITFYQKAIALNPKDDDAYNNIGIAYGAKKEYDKAIEAYQKAIEINPKKDEAYNNMGNTYYAKKEYDKAIEAYQKAIEINSTRSYLYSYIGSLYYKTKNLNKARDYYTQALKLGSNDSSSFTNL